MEEASLNLGDLFTNPPSPPPPEPTVVRYVRPETLWHKSSWRSLSIRLVGSHSLWGHHLWNAARSFAAYLDKNSEQLCAGKTILELGAGGGLPSLVSTLCGAKRVVMTDYPDRELVENMKINVAENMPDSLRGRISVKGYIWGRPVSELFASGDDGSDEKFDLVIMSDLIFNHSQHDALLQTAESCLKKRSTDDDIGLMRGTPCVLVFYTHHRPRLAARDLEFFAKATERGWICQEIVTERFQPMFPDDPGDEEIRSVVHGWYLARWQP